jgi:mycothiol system anti-sigma-R factor
MGSPEVGGSCDEVFGAIWLYVDHEAPPRTCEELEAHLAECQTCQRAVRFDRRFKQLVRRCADPGPVPSGVIESLRLRVEQIVRTDPPSQPA